MTVKSPTISGRVGTALVVALVLSCAQNPCRAHSDSEAQIDLTLSSGQVQGRWQAALRDLNHVLELDADGDARITRVEWEAGRFEATRYFQDHLELLSDSQLIPLEIGGWSLVQTWQGLAATLEFSAQLPAQSGALHLEYRAFFENDPWHRARVVMALHDGRTATELLSPERTRLMMIPALPELRPRPDHGHVWAIGAAAAVVFGFLLISRRAPTSPWWGRGRRLFVPR